MMMKKICLSSMALAALFVASCDSTDDDMNYNATDANFVMMASMGNHAEVQAGQLASTKGIDPDVKMFGQMMVTDHTTAQTELASIASNLGLLVATGPDSAHTAMMQQLNAMPAGRMFDSMYIHMQVMDHNTNIALHQNEANNGMAPQLKTFAQNKLPVLQMHKQHADSIAQKF